MTHYPDLEPLGDDGVVTVGWLEPTHDYTKGPVSQELFAKLVALFKNPLQRCAVGGFHTCNFCRFTSGPRELCFDDERIVMGSTNLYLPGTAGVVYYTPSLVLHSSTPTSTRRPSRFRRQRSRVLARGRSSTLGR